MGATSKGAWDGGEVAIQGRFNVIEYFIVRSSFMFDDFIGEGFQKIVNLVDSGYHRSSSVFLLYV